MTSKKITKQDIINNLPDLSEKISVEEFNSVWESTRQKIVGNFQNKTKKKLNKAEIINNNINILKFIETKLRFRGDPLELNSVFNPVIKLVNELVNNNKSKDIIIYKKRMIGASVFAASLLIALTQLKPDFNCIHVLPSLGYVSNMSQDIYDDLIFGAFPGREKRRGGFYKSCVEENISWGKGCNTKTVKKFKNNSSLSIESSGVNGSRLRGKNANLVVLDGAHFMFEGIFDLTKTITKPNGIRLFIIEWVMDSYQGNDRLEKLIGNNSEIFNFRNEESIFFY